MPYVSTIEKCTNYGQPGNGKRRGTCPQGQVCQESGACMRGNEELNDLINYL